jgi:hypothetical protein
MESGILALASSSAERITALLVAATLLWLLANPLHAEGTDYIVRPVPDGESEQPAARPISKFQYTFGLPATWPSAIHWRYNHANAPSQFSANKALAIQQITTASAKWTAVCGIKIVYDGETTTPPNSLIGDQPDHQNVVGWQTLSGASAAITYSWYQSGFGGRTIVDSDILMSPRYVTSSAQIARSVSHEWGHAVGLSHSNVDGALMSGPPDSTYSDLSDLTPDDVHGCRCLYGPPAGLRAGYVCSLPEDIDLGALNVGTTGSQRQVTVNNGGNAALAITGIRTGGSEFFVGNNSCIPGASLAPGASCTFGVQARLAITGTRGDKVTIDTSEGPYRIPVHAQGIAALPPAAANFEGVWSNAPAESESGWGINFAHQGDVIFATWFTYDSNGKAWWLTMTATRTGDNVYTGTLYETRGPSFSAVPFSPNAVSYYAVGTATLTLSDASNGMFAYSVDGVIQTKAITRVVFGPVPVCAFGAQPNLALATNYQDVWWAAAGAGEAGWGVNFTHQGDTIFATWFTYDFDGTPLWLSVTALKTAAGVYSGTLDRTTGPAFSAVPFDPLKVARTPVGTLTLTFGDGNNVAFAYTVTLGIPPVSVTQTKQLTRLVFRAPGTVCQ